MLANLLNLVKDLQINERLMLTIEHRLVFFLVCTLLLVLNGIDVGLKIDDAACVFSAFQNVNHGVTVPTARVFRCRVGTFDAFAVLVGSRGEYTVGLLLICDLRRASSVHAHLVDTLYHGCRFGINHPMLLVLRFFHISVRHIGCQRYAFFTLCLGYSSDFAAGITSIELISG